MKRLSKQTKDNVISVIRQHGTITAAAERAHTTVAEINQELRASAIFRKRLAEAREDGKRHLADRAIDLIRDYAEGNVSEKTDRNRLTAAIALANAYEPGFRGATSVQGKIEHEIKVITGIPRPKYQIIDAPKTKQLRAGDKTD